MSDTFHIHNKLRKLDTTLFFSLCNKDLLLSCMYYFKLFIPRKSEGSIACLSRVHESSPQRRS